MKNKIWLMLACCVLLIACLFQMVGCSEKESGVDAVVKKYIEAQKNADKEAIVELLCPDYYEHLLNTYCSEPYNYSADDAKEAITESYRLFISDNNMFLLIMADGADMQEYYTIKHKIGRKYTATDEEIDIFFEYNKNENGFDEKIDKMEIIEFTLYAMTPENDIVHEVKHFAVCMEIDGKWYMASYEDKPNLDMWADTVHNDGDLNIVYYDNQIQWLEDIIDEWYYDE